ncbi:PQQ-dependent sugar dehydrogenase [Granulosicoccaceae sp. 1_MG-2023]|nr:PQQ-dependent sugar dehydrogenase [Granulosicoccaceae sp. 1_MG-2023]
MRRLAVLLGLSLALVDSAAAQAAVSAAAADDSLKVEILADRLDHPWGLAFLPDGRMLVSERGGTLLLLSADGRKRETVAGVPAVASGGQGGLLDVAVDPDFADNRRVFLSYVGADRAGRRGTEVLRAELSGNALTDSRVIFRLEPKTNSTRHFGSRLVFGPDETLFITLGDRGDKDRAQDLNDHAGSLIRINTDGSVPDDNPFVNQAGRRAAIFSYGHRNIQGAALHPQSGQLWLHEHGPQGGDELNIARAGRNYGWPVITYGVNYGIGTQIGEGTAKAGMEQPLYYWVPSIAPSGMTFYSGDLFPRWRGDLFVGSLKFRTLVRLSLNGTQVIAEERLLSEQLGRIRDVVQGPDGALYVLTDEARGVLARLSPQ